MNNPKQLILSPSDFVAITNQTLEYAMPFVTIEGELAEVRVRKDRWLYFKLKDDYASVDCFGTVYMMPSPLEDGMNVRISGRPKLHEKFGFSFQVQSITPAGEGSIKKAFELLRQKLENEGLFDAARKRNLPYPPQKIALLTSTEGAAIKDFQKIINKRWPLLEIQVHDVLVQGEKAPESIQNIIETVNASSELVDVLVLIRGGGSAEDLQAFNDERVVRAVSASRIPTLVAIGHEQDESLAELAADMRASTPSNAAELLVPDILAEQRELKVLKRNVSRLFIDFSTKIERQIEHLRVRLLHHINTSIETEKQALKSFSKQLELVDPKNVLKRGYVIVKKQDKLIASSGQLASKDQVQLVFHDGEKRAIIE